MPIMTFASQKTLGPPFELAAADSTASRRDLRKEISQDRRSFLVRPIMTYQPISLAHAHMSMKATSILLCDLLATATLKITKKYNNHTP